jgi:uncharacterized damage-inducible protein DinB
MRYQDQVVKATYKALEDVCRAAKAVPEDKADWAPMGEARSVLSQMQEIAVAGNWFLPIVREGKMPEFDEHARRESIRLRRSFDTIDKCIEAAQTSTAELCQAISEFSDDQLERELSLPFGGGTVMSMADVLALHSWNMIYHLGQINYVQLMLGDREMH